MCPEINKASKPVMKKILSEHKWSLATACEQDKINAIAEQLDIDEILASLLVQRGIDTYEKAEKFFRPSLDDLHSPFLMKDMEKAVQRLQKAIDEGERIMVFGDYDVDGTTAVSLVFSFLKNYCKDKLTYYIPDRYEEGYGVSYQAIDYAKANNYSLIIALDCGIKAIDKVAYAKEADIDFIICDHHRPGDELPPAYAVLDPKRDDCEYPYKELSGCGVGFKLVQAFCEHNDIPFYELMPYLDLMAISIAADIVPITGENRVFTAFGLQRINESPRPGIQAILGLMKQKKELTVTDVVFIIAPRINAAGRIDSGNSAVRLLITENIEEAQGYAKEIDAFNTDRKDLDKQITAEALEMIQTDEARVEAKTTVVYQEDWHKGVIGIVASRLTEHYYRPTIVLTKSGDKLAGSARSVRGFDVYNAIDACSDCIIQFGGHKYAAGLTLLPEQLEDFMQRFETVVAEQIDEQLLIPEIRIDIPINFDQITPKFFRILKQFGPFGPGNMKPVFVTENVLDTRYARTVGGDGAHLKMTLFQQGRSGIKFDAIGFKLGDFLPSVQQGVPFRVAYTLEQNDWNGKTSIQLNIKDIKFS